MKPQIVQFEQSQIRRIHYNGEWWFSIIDVIEAITETNSPSRYWSELKKKLGGEGFELFDIIEKLKFLAPDGKMRGTDCASRETLLRIIQSIPSKKAEPFKLWLASAGEQQLVDQTDPLARLRAMYQQLGRSPEWIDARLKSVEVRKLLTDEWSKRNVQGIDYARLTDILSLGTFGLTTAGHKNLKQLEKENLRDHMSVMELAFQILAEETNRQLARKDNAHGFDENAEASQKAGKAVGDSRRRLEKQTGLKVVTEQNYLPPKKE